MKDIKITDNHPVKKRKRLGPIGRFLLKLVNWNIVGNLPDKKKNYNRISTTLIYIRCHLCIFCLPGSRFKILLPWFGFNVYSYCCTSSI